MRPIKRRAADRQINQRTILLTSDPNSGSHQTRSINTQLSMGEDTRKGLQIHEAVKPLPIQIWTNHQEISAEQILIV